MLWTHFSNLLSNIKILFIQAFILLWKFTVWNSKNLVITFESASRSFRTWPIFAGFSWLNHCSRFTKSSLWCMRSSIHIIPFLSFERILSKALILISSKLWPTGISNIYHSKVKAPVTIFGEQGGNNFCFVILCTKQLCEHSKCYKSRLTIW